MNDIRWKPTTSPTSVNWLLKMACIILKSETFKIVIYAIIIHFLIHIVCPSLNNYVGEFSKLRLYENLFYKRCVLMVSTPTLLFLFPLFPLVLGPLL